MISLHWLLGALMWAFITGFFLHHAFSKEDSHD